MVEMKRLLRLLNINIKKKLIDIGLAGSSMDLEIRFWTVSSAIAELRILDVEGLILVNQLETKISLLNP